MVDNANQEGVILTANQKQTTNWARWLLCGVLIVTGVVVVVLSIIAINQATILVEWSTASELDTVGFNVLRGETPDGPFEQINQQIIPVADQPLSGGEYTYTDAQAVRGKTFYYLLEDLALSGERTNHGPIMIMAKNNAPLQLGLGGVLIACGFVFAWIFREPKAERNNSRIYDK